jgi:pyruvate-formate lyase
MRPYWRALAYREYSDSPEPVVRAQAFRTVLLSMPLHFYSGERICGSSLGWTPPQLPSDIPESEFLACKAEHDARGQRNFPAGWDHSLADYPTLLSVGIGGLIDRVHDSMRCHHGADEEAFLSGALISLEAFSEFIQRYADAALLRQAQDAQAVDLAGVLERIVLAPPETLHEAMQLVWLTLLAFLSEGRYAMALGRIDQYLLPFYENDLKCGRITRDEALELFCHLWVRMEEIREVTNICIGGLTSDGQDATNELSYICLEATRLVQSPHTNLSARFHDDTPERFHEACFEVIRTGVGFPAIFNDHVLLEGLVEIGIPPEVARDYCMVGCIETMLPGRQQAWSDSRFNMPRHLMMALQGLRGQGDLTYERVLTEFQTCMTRGIADHVAWLNRYIAGFPPDRFPDPFLSALTRDCIARARDINDGGAEFKRFHGICIMGLATTADSLAALRKLVFEDKQIEFEELMQALDANFESQEPLRQLLAHHAPHYGNDNPYVDSIAAELVDWTSRECLKYEVYGGGRYVSAMAANTSNIPAGAEVGATPDGRLAFTPLSDAASPYFGRDVNGPTAFLNSVATPDYHRVLTGSVINMKFDPEHFDSPEGRRCFVALTKAFVEKRIPELQFNFTGNATLEAAQREPENYGDLVVRVSGFSAYFTSLGEVVQNDIIRRRAHSVTGE